MSNKFSRLFFIFLGILFVLNLIQGSVTELLYDEAYYWYYAQDLSWGYFDHPPMVAFLIWLSSLVFDGEMGVRFMSCVLGIGTVSILWLLIEDPKKKQYIPHFFLLLFSMALFNAYGFLTLPDTPLLFFTALFLLVYKRFISNPTWPKALVLGLVMACLMYSKYHAVLVILFTLLSNISLLKNKYAWVAVLCSLACYSPHFLWLYQNDFVSLEYHISERPNQPYSFSGFTLGYLLNLLVNFGLLFPWFYYALFTAKPKDKFTKALVYVTFGVILFFFLSTFHRRSQAQWVIVICIPMAILAYQLLLDNAKARKWMFGLSIASLVLLCYARAWLVYQPLLPKIFETHGTENWVHTLNRKVENVPVVFENSYRTSSMYHFYSGEPSFSLNNIFYRRNQYSIDASEAKIQGKRIAYVTKYADSGDFYFYYPDGTKMFVKYKDNFKSYRRLKGFFDQNQVKRNKAPQLLKVYNPYAEKIPLDQLVFRLAFLNAYKQIQETQTITIQPVEENTLVLKPRDTTEFNFRLPAHKTKKPQFVKFSISEFGLPTGINSPSIPLD